MDDTFGHIPLLDAVDLDILMHKEAHFGGSFEVMIDYYNKDGVGVMPDFDEQRINELFTIEKSLGVSLVESLLPLPAKQMVEKSKKLYQELRSAYEQIDQGIAIKVSDLILTEEELPEKEIQNLVLLGQMAFGPMIHLIESTDFYDPLFPGYGRSPMFAAMVLEKLKDKSAIPHLFAALGQENFFTDDAIIKSLISFGDEAKTFLIKKLTGEPFTKENIYAITALTTLEDDEEVAKVSLVLLEKPAAHKNENFMRYLIFACSGLKHEIDRMKFTQFQSMIPSNALKKECGVIIKNWM
jgi:hypothetical protein